jgi:hypothetical protein
VAACYVQAWYEHRARLQHDHPLVDNHVASALVYILLTACAVQVRPGYNTTALSLFNNHAAFVVMSNACAARRFGLYTVPGYNMTAPLVDNHVAMKNSPALDCLHYCQPGQPEVG